MTATLVLVIVVLASYAFWRRPARQVRRDQVLARVKRFTRGEE